LVTQCHFGHFRQAWGSSFDTLVAASRALLLLKTLVSFFQQLIGRQNGDFPFVTVEVFGVERKDLNYTVSLHCGYESGVVSLLAADLVFQDQPVPVLIHGGCVRDERRKDFKSLQLLDGLGWGQAQTIVLEWTYGYDPEFPLSLGCEERVLAAFLGRVRQPLWLFCVGGHRSWPSDRGYWSQQ
jgi:hypothetical protein